MLWTLSIAHQADTLSDPGWPVLNFTVHTINDLLWELTDTNTSATDLLHFLKAPV